MMDQSPLEIALLHRSKWLIHALIISVTFNIALIATFSYFALKEKKLITTVCENSAKSNPHLKSISRRNTEVLQQYFTYSFGELVQELINETHVEEGQRHCDLALACLVAFHHFDLERALSGFPVEKRNYAFQHGEQWFRLTLFAGLNDDCLSALRQFAKVELWPLTPEGLFAILQEWEGEISPDFIEAFCLTSEFYTIERAFSRLPYLVSRGVLLQLFIGAEWAEIARLAQEIRDHPKGEIENLGGFLTLLVERNSTLAAHLLIGMEQEFALKYLTDDQLEKLMGLLNEKTPEVETFLKAVVESLRADRFRCQAEAALLGRTGGNFSLPRKESSVSQEVYVVRRGDTLWKLSRDLGVSIADIKQINKLESNVLVPGKELFVPKRKR